jgi:tetratricopeptide (TPR) repeat protein
MMTRVAELTIDGGQKVDMFYRIGRAMEEKLSDRFGAREKFEMALDLDPKHMQSLAALRTIAVDEADWDGACRYLEQEQSLTEAPRQRARLLVELGKIRDEMLGEHDAAIRAYEQAMSLDEDCEEAALPLLEEYSSLERWTDAAPLAEMLVRRSKNREKAEQHDLQKRLGFVMTKTGAHDKALAAYQAAHQLDLTDSETIRGVADAAGPLGRRPLRRDEHRRRAGPAVRPGGRVDPRGGAADLRRGRCRPGGGRLMSRASGRQGSTVHAVPASRRLIRT